MPHLGNTLDNSPWASLCVVCPWTALGIPVQALSLWASPLCFPAPDVSLGIPPAHPCAEHDLGLCPSASLCMVCPSSLCFPVQDVSSAILPVHPCVSSQGLLRLRCPLVISMPIPGPTPVPILVSLPLPIPIPSSFPPQSLLPAELTPPPLPPPLVNAAASPPVVGAAAVAAGSCSLRAGGLAVPACPAPPPWVRVPVPVPPPPLCAPGPPALSAAAMGSLLSRRIAGVEDIDIQANSAYRYPPKSGEGRGDRGEGRAVPGPVPPGPSGEAEEGVRERPSPAWAGSGSGCAAAQPAPLAERPCVDGCPWARRWHRAGSRGLRREGVSVPCVQGSAVPPAGTARAAGGH